MNVWELTLSCSFCTLNSHCFAGSVRFPILQRQKKKTLLYSGTIVGNNIGNSIHSRHTEEYNILELAWGKLGD